MRILLDMDGVLADFESHFWDLWIGYVKDAPVIPRSERTTQYIQDNLPVEYRAIAWNLMKEPGFFLRMPPMRGAVAGVRALVDAGHDLAVVTKPIRSSLTCASEKQRWVRDWLGKDFHRNLVICADKTLVRGDVLIDDAPEVEGALEPEWAHVVYDAPGNRHVDRARVADWDEIVRRYA